MKRQFVANTPGVVGYLFVLLGWLWMALIALTYTNWLENLQQNQPAATSPTFNLPDLTLPDTVTTVLLLAVVLLMIGLSIYASIKVPIEAVKQTSHVAHKVADTLVDTALRNQPLPKKRRLRLTSRLVEWLKIITVCTPILVVSAIVFFTTESTSLSPELAVFISIGASLMALFSFVLQYALAWMLKVPLGQLL